VLFQRHGAAGHEAGGASSRAAGATALGRHVVPFLFAVFVVTAGMTASGSSPRARRVVRVPQPDSTFRHSLHASLTCTTCHGTSTTHGGLKFAIPAGCLACHHGAEQPVPCGICHNAESLGPRPMPMTFAISGRPQPVTRTIAFAHATHGALACAQCHGSDARRAVTTTCASCHANHHTATANCAGCHPAARTGHDRTVHDGCARCHTDTVVAALPASRQVCLVCHQEQRGHYPAGNCATCHALADHDMMRAGRAGGGR